MSKTNPILAAFEKKLRAQYDAALADEIWSHKKRIEYVSEIHAIAALLAAHDVFQAGPGRAPKFLIAYLEVKEQIAKDLVADVGDSITPGGNGDPEFLKTRRDLATALKAILGDKWDEYKTMFPLLEIYW